MKQSYEKSFFSFLLGFAFLQQAITSIISGAVFYTPYVDEENITNTMANFASNYAHLQWSILLDIITALGIILLGVCMYFIAKKQSQVLATLALCFYLFEAGLLAVSKFFLYSVVELSLSKSATDESILLIADTLLKTHDYIYSTHIIPFGLGAILFYYFIYRSTVLPSWLALWGLITVPIILIGVTLGNFGVEVPFALYLPYVPFEFFTGIWILLRGLKSPGLN